LLLDLMTTNDAAATVFDIMVLVDVNGAAAFASDTAVIGTRDQKGQTGNNCPLPSGTSVILSSS
jgi:hypothetical protein